MWWALGGSTVALISITTAIFASKASSRREGAYKQRIKELEKEVASLHSEIAARNVPLPHRSRMGGVLDAVVQNGGSSD